MIHRITRHRGLRWILAAVLLAALAACGGGDGAANGSPGNGTGTSAGGTDGGTAATRDDDALAATAALSIVVTVPDNTVNLSWKDGFPSGATYAVQMQGAEGTFTTVTSLAAMGSGNTLSWRQALQAPTTFRVVATDDGRTFSLQTAAGATSLAASLPSTPISLAVTSSPGNAANVRGTSVQLNYFGPAAESIRWLVDQLATGTAVGTALVWDSTTVASGPHTIEAIVTASGVTYRASLPIIVTNPGTSPSDIAISSGSGDVIYVLAPAAGYASMSLSVDGQSIQTLTQPNACTGLSCAPSAYDAFRFLVHGLQIGSGTHAAVLTRTPASGAATQENFPLTVWNAPRLTISTPAGASFVDGTGSLSISGTAGSDLPGSVSVQAFLGTVPIPVQAADGTHFTGSLDLSGIAPGAYSLTIRASDSYTQSTVQQLQVVVASSAQAVYPSNFALGQTPEQSTAANYIQLLAADGDSILYTAPDMTERVREVGAQTEVSLSGSLPLFPVTVTPWMLTGGLAYYSSTTSSTGIDGCPAFSNCTFQWDSQGAVSNITAALGGSPRAAVGGYLLVNGPNARYALYGTRDGSLTPLAVPNSASWDLAVTGSGPQFCYLDFIGDPGHVNCIATSTRTTTQLASPSVDRSAPLRTDGTHVAWVAPQAGQAGSFNVVPASLLAGSIAGGQASTVAASIYAGNVALGNGVLAWEELGPPHSSGISTTPVQGPLVDIKAYTFTGSPVQLTTDTSARLLAATNGSVIYQAGTPGKIYRWNAATGATTVLIDIAPNLLISGNFLYFTLGNNNQLFQVVVR
ncbi:hypothetical protein [Burkholderia gladioli]|uniref:hypothetical protein n=1 Tax=Burkholderia gladioli TaxID=28095 RepID=UPI000F51B7B8|nr:hypothetical protein [Burkholderia gladioli]